MLHFKSQNLTLQCAEDYLLLFDLHGRMTSVAEKSKLEELKLQSFRIVGD